MQPDQSEEVQTDLDAMELKHRRQVKSTFANYGKDMKASYWKIFSDVKLPHYFELARKRKRQRMEEAILANQIFLSQILKFACENENCNEGEGLGGFEPDQTTLCHNIPKIRTTVKQFFREWCSESPEIKDFTMLVESAKQYIQTGCKILVPGSGLGRLVLELVEAGYGAQGNQVTYFMLYGSNFILNGCQRKEQFTIYPFIHSYSYHEDEEHIFRSVKIPDKFAADVVGEGAEFSMAGGQFVEIYSKTPQEFEGIVTCFFIDTANNVFDYIDTLYTVLKEKGIWINYGPLLYHYKDMANEISVEVSWEELSKYIDHRGFELLAESKQVTTYCHDPFSSYTHQYHCLLSVFGKK